MNSFKHSLTMSFTCALVLGLVASAGATVMDSSAFDWKYEFEGTTASTPDNLDIDGNGSPDMMQWGNAGTVAGGIMTLGSNASYMDDFGWKPALVNGIWKANMFGATSGFTIEARIKIDSDNGRAGATSLVAGPKPLANAPDGWLVVGGSSMKWTVEDGVTPMNTDNNTDGFHVFRMALNPVSNAYDVWRDGVLVGSSLPDVFNPSLNGLDRLYLGDVSPSTDGVTRWDYVRFTSGYYAPVPEPSTLILLSIGTIGLLAYAWRRRK